MKNKRPILILLFAIMLVALVACNSTSLTITFVFGEGFENATTTVELGKAFTAPTIPQNDGYTLAGWYKDADCTQPWDFESDTAITNITLYAKWQPSDYATVTFVFGEGFANSTASVKTGEKTSAPATPTKEGFEIEGWYKDADCTQPWNFVTDAVSANTTLYAKWQAKATATATVTFVFGEGFENATATVEVGNTVQQPTAPEKTGYEISQWTLTDFFGHTSVWNFETDKVTQNITLKATWTQTSTPETDPTLRDDIITVAQALAIIDALEDGATATEQVYLRGQISITDDSYGKLDLTDSTGTIMVYGSYSADGSIKWSSMTDKPQTGDTVLMLCTLKKYKSSGGQITPEVLKGYIIAYKTGEHVEEPPVELPPDGSELTIPEALAIGKVLKDGEITEERYTLRGTVKAVTNPTFGEMYLVDDNGNEIYVYGLYSQDGSVRYDAMTEKPYQNDKVVVTAVIQNYKGTTELKSVYLQSFEHVEIEIHEEDYTAMTIAAAREAEEGVLIKTSGVVAQITYASGKIPSGFILIDGTSSIYVYDSQIAPRVAIGNTVTVLAKKTWWILETEQSNAANFGYKGCCQLSEATLKENDGLTSDFATDWIETTTVKDIINTPVTTDISTLVYKVDAYITKSVKEGAGGFTNYYFNDLDGQTGTYVYTQCNGSDFVWIDEFVGKICTVYVTALNAKSTSTGCSWRFVPVQIKDEGFVFDKNLVSKFVVEYHVLDQFVSRYAADPEIELVTTVSSELLDFEGATVSYTSSNTDIAYIADGVFHIGSAFGKAILTISATYQDYASYTTEIEIEVIDPAEEYGYINVANAIETAVGEIITVRGIVGPSLVNQAGGFYLMDDTGLIAVKFRVATDIAQIKIGDEIIITGKRDAYGTNDTHPGQICITGITLELNLYGKHEYNVANLITTATYDDIIGYSKEVSDANHSVEVYQVKVKVIVADQNVQLHNPNGGDEYLMIYAGSVDQSAWLTAYKNQVITVDLALCNWNRKDPYRVCVLAMHLEDGSVILNELNFN